jgi:glycosyltransferase involved in cell wall biosynthesis
MQQTLAMPRRLGALDQVSRFNAVEMAQRLNVLFIIPQPIRSPAISVHATLMRCLDPDRVRIHVVYNRRAADESHLSTGRSVLDVLPRRPHVSLVPAELGPSGDAPRPQLIADGLRTFAPAARDLLRLVSYVRRHRIDVLHCEHGVRDVFYGHLLSRMSGCSCIVHFHSKYGSWMSPLSRLGVRNADAIIAVSSWTAQVMADAGISAQKIFPILNGIDLTPWSQTVGDGAAVRRELGLTPDHPLVVSVAQLTAWKRQATLIEAFARVAALHPAARLMLVGRDWTRAGSYADQLQRQVADAGLDRQVIFAGHRSDVRDVLAAADIFALPSVDDPCALAHLEAMASGKPIIAVRAGGTPELVVDGETGLLAAPDDVDGLAANLLALIDDPDRRCKLGRNALRRAREHFTAERMADEVEAVYRLVSAQHRA